MIRVRKIAHATYEMPELDKQVEYYTGILGLTLTAKEKDAAYLANTVDHHAVVLRRGSVVKCTRIGFQIGPDEDLDAFDKQTAAHGIKTTRKKDPEPTISEMVAFEDPKGTIMEEFKRPEPAQQKFQRQGIIPHKLGHVAFHVTDVKHITKFYCDVLGFRVSDWMGEIFSFLRCGPDHHTINLIETGSNRHFHTAFELRDWAAFADRLRFPEPQWLHAAMGAGAAWHRPQPLHLSSQSKRVDYRALCGARPDAG
jgi:catechol 2,3-dioxygenase-like lactoylglutathione lyase family enzyme